MGSSLESQIRYVEDTIRIKKELGKDASFEEGLIKEWRKYLPGGSKHHLWLRHCGFKATASSPKSKSRGV